MFIEKKRHLQLSENIPILSRFLQNTWLECLVVLHKIRMTFKCLKLLQGQFGF